MRILGIDPGSSVTGYGVVERAAGGLREVAHGTLRAERGQALAPRLAAIQRGLADVIERHAPDLAVVERVFMAASARSALVLGHARGVALAAAAAADVPVAEYSAREIKLAVAGSGDADKRQVQAMVKRLLGLSRLPPTDAADALAAAICHLQAGPLAGSLAGTRARRGRGRRRSGRFVMRLSR